MGGLGLGIPIKPDSAFGKIAEKVANSMIGASGMAAQAAGDTISNMSLFGALQQAVKDGRIEARVGL